MVRPPEAPDRSAGSPSGHVVHLLLPAARIRLNHRAPEWTRYKIFTIREVNPWGVICFFEGGGRGRRAEYRARWQDIDDVFQKVVRSEHHPSYWLHQLACGHIICCEYSATALSDTAVCEYCTRLCRALQREHQPKESPQCT